MTGGVIDIEPRSSISDADQSTVDTTGRRWESHSERRLDATMQLARQPRRVGRLRFDSTMKAGFGVLGERHRNAESCPNPIRAVRNISQGPSPRLGGRSRPQRHQPAASFELGQ
jgi:hypothetical protein